MRARPTFALMILLAAACKPDLGPEDSLVSTTRILAVRAEPPEAAPGKPVVYTALVASPSGTVDAATIDWRFCNAPKPVGENNVVSTSCLELSSLVAAGVGAATSAATPAHACALFGPDTPPGGFRPRDPDATGGYYQPLRLDLPGADVAFDLSRVTCNLANASADIATAFAAAYVPNVNPHLLPLVATEDGATVALDAIHANARLSFQASWAPADAETYAYFDPPTQAVTTKRESLRVAWFATSGPFDSESTGRAEDDLATVTENGWTAPGAPGVVHVWVVLRDSRGGNDFAAYDLAVAP